MTHPTMVNVELIHLFKAFCAFGEAWGMPLVTFIIAWFSYSKLSSFLKDTKDQIILEIIKKLRGLPFDLASVELEYDDSSFFKDHAEFDKFIRFLAEHKDFLPDNKLHEEIYAAAISSFTTTVNLKRDFSSITDSQISKKEFVDALIKHYGRLIEGDKIKIDKVANKLFKSLHKKNKC